MSPLLIYFSTSCNKHLCASFYMNYFMPFFKYQIDIDMRTQYEACKNDVFYFDEVLSFTDHITMTNPRAIFIARDFDCSFR